MSTTLIPPRLFIDEPNLIDPNPVPLNRRQQIEIRSPDGGTVSPVIEPGETTYTVNTVHHRPGPTHAFDTSYEVATLTFDIPPPGMTRTTREGYTIRNVTGTLASALPDDAWRGDTYEGLRQHRNYTGAAGARYDNNSTIRTAGSAGPTLTGITIERLREFLKENLELRTKLTLDGTDLTVRTRLVLRNDNEETIISDDEDSVDLSELSDRL